MQTVDYRHFALEAGDRVLLVDDLIATGGTTGLPKGTQWRHEDLWRSLRNTRRGPLADLEAEHIVRTLTRHRWNISESARVLGIDRTTLYNKMKKYDICEPGN